MIRGPAESPAMERELISGRQSHPQKEGRDKGLGLVQVLRRPIDGAHAKAGKDHAQGKGCVVPAFGLTGWVPQPAPSS